MSADFAQRLYCFAAAPFAFGEQGGGAVEADAQHVVGFQRDEGLAVLEIRAETADAGDDHLAGFGMGSDIAGQGQQADSDCQIEVGRGHGFRQGDALGLALVALFAKLYIVAIGPLAHGDHEAAIRIDAELQGLVSDTAGLAAAIEGAGIAAVGVVGAADEGAELAELEIKPAAVAGRALAAVLARAVVGEDMGAEDTVQRIQNVGHPQLLGVVDLGDESGPEFPQNQLPFDLAIGDVVEPVLEFGGEIIFHIALEETFQEGGDQASAILRVEPLLVEPHIVALLQHREDAGVGRGPADAEFLEPLDQGRLGEARRRLGEMLVGPDLAAVQGVVGGEGGQHAVAIVVPGAVVAAFAIEPEKAVEGDARARGA